MKVLKNKKTTEQPTKDNYLARVVGITNIGKQPGFLWKGEQLPDTYKVEVTFELVTSSMKDGRPFHVSKEFANDEGSKNTVALFLACNTDDLDWSKLIEKPCMVAIDVNEKGYANIKSVAGVPNGIPVPALRNPVYLFDLYSEHPDVQQFQTFSDFKREKITRALDFKTTPLYKALAEVAGDDTDF
jgi:hypothetical protein